MQAWPPHLEAADKALTEEIVARHANEQELCVAQESSATMNQDLQAARDLNAALNVDLQAARASAVVANKSCLPK
jgi:hypothetical protein